MDENGRNHRSAISLPDPRPRRPKSGSPLPMYLIMVNGGDPRRDASPLVRGDASRSCGG